MRYLHTFDNTTLSYPKELGNEVVIAFKVGDDIYERYVSFDELKFWVNSIEKPCNTQMQIDAKPCPLCRVWKRDFDYIKYCGSCGKALHD